MLSHPLAIVSAIVNLLCCCLSRPCFSAVPNQALGARASEVPPHSRLVLQNVTVEGFGPFKTPVSYPLADRGVVAVTGRNEDDAAAVSNGAGKTSLLTALLWAFKVCYDRFWWPIADSHA